MNQKETMMIQTTPIHSAAIIEKAEREQRGGKYRPIVKRTIDGKVCRSIAHVFMVGAVAYWNVSYIIDGTDAAEYNPQVEALYQLTLDRVSELNKQGKQTILWRY